VANFAGRAFAHVSRDDINVHRFDAEESAMTLKQHGLITWVAAGLICFGTSTQAQAQLPGHVQTQMHGNARGHSQHDALTVPIATAPGSPVTGTGTFRLQRFINDRGEVKAVGIVTGTFTDGTQTVSIARNVTLPVSFGQSPAPAVDELNDAFESGPSDGRNAAAAQLVCPILHLDLGPLDLDILGLRVELSRIILDITAEAAGGLLGSLLCAVANLLNGPAGPLVAVLNQILGALLA
jgi:hypothetical protein